MALTGLDIYKLLPKTNCKKCGRPTCLAFAMQLAQKKANLSDCPDVSEEAKKVLGAASAPPIKLVTVGTGAKKQRLVRKMYYSDMKKNFIIQQVWQLPSAMI